MSQRLLSFFLTLAFACVALVPAHGQQSTMGATGAGFTFKGDATSLTNLNGIELGDYNMDAIGNLWGKFQKSGAIKILNVGDSTGGDVTSGLMEYLYAAIGVNGIGVSATFPNAVWCVISTNGAKKEVSINGTGFTSTNYWGPHYGLSNGAAIYFNRYSAHNLSSAFPVNTNAYQVDTLCVMWVRQTNNNAATPGAGGTATIDVSTNGGAFVTIGNIDSSLNNVTPQLGITNIPLTLSNYTVRISGTGPGSQYTEIIGAGLYKTNGSGAFIWNLSSSGHTWVDYQNQSTNVLFQLLTNVQPDLIICESVHAPITQYVLDTLSNCTPAQIVIMACPPSTNNGVSYVYPLSLTNRQMAINNISNSFNKVAFCDTFSWMADTNQSQALGWYAVEAFPGVHFSQAGQNYEADLFLRSIGIGDVYSINIGSTALGWSSGMNSDAYVPIGIGTRNDNGLMGHFDVYTTCPTVAGHFFIDGITDSSPNMGLFWLNGAPSAYTTYNKLQYAFVGFQNNTLILTPPNSSSGNFVLSFGDPNVGLGGVNPEMGLCLNGTWTFGRADGFRTGANVSNYGEGVVEVHNLITVGQGSGNEFWATNGANSIVRITNNSGTGVAITTTNTAAANSFTQVGQNGSNIVASGYSTLSGYIITSNTFPNLGARFANLGNSGAILWNSNGVHGYWIWTNTPGATAGTNAAW